MIQSDFENIDEFFAFEIPRKIIKTPNNVPPKANELIFWGVVKRNRRSISTTLKSVFGIPKKKKTSLKKSIRWNVTISNRLYLNAKTTTLLGTAVPRTYSFLWKRTYTNQKYGDLRKVKKKIDKLNTSEI